MTRALLETPPTVFASARRKRKCRRHGSRGVGVEGAEADVAGGEDTSRKMVAAVTAVVAATEGEEVIFRHFSMVDPSVWMLPFSSFGE